MQAKRQSFWQILVRFAEPCEICAVYLARTQVTIVDTHGETDFDRDMTGGVGMEIAQTVTSSGGVCS
ncbi:hypothetical protein CP557_02775 [Natrinema ejinorense]|uniref:Uncharacterized protein n=1 Tax=Natrinema ejinorense TaxID=373386 RepID=A0A2A5QRS2_9EURY|nr:hypothetical protein CP557_02775 [Natrinema ejinorense]